MIVYIKVYAKYHYLETITYNSSFSYKINIADNKYIRYNLYNYLA